MLRLLARLAVVAGAATCTAPFPRVARSGGISGAVLPAVRPDATRRRAEPRGSTRPHLHQRPALLTGVRPVHRHALMLRPLARGSTRERERTAVRCPEVPRVGHRLHARQHHHRAGGDVMPEPGIEPLSDSATVSAARAAADRRIATVRAAAPANEPLTLSDCVRCGTPPADDVLDPVPDGGRACDCPDYKAPKPILRDEWNSRRVSHWRGTDA
jgi:hypothetical protein